jgi:GNAT superfamily N-acetyltransferase
VTLEIRPLAEGDLAAADRIFRLAFGKEFGVPDPISFRGDSELVRPRWRSRPDGALGAYRDGELVGSSFAARWGSFGVLGPISVDPRCQGAGVGKELLEPTVALFDRWGVRQAGLFTFPQSAKHVALYQRFAFWPQQLTVVMAKAPTARALPADCTPYRDASALPACAELTGEIFAGLDASAEIRAVAEQHLGETLLMRDGKRLAAFAICHIGKGSEGGSGTAFVKFAAVRAGLAAAATLQRLVAACEALAAQRGAGRLVAGVNTARRDAYRVLLGAGFRAFLHGVAMQRPDATGFNRPDVFVLDDWR